MHTTTDRYPTRDGGTCNAGPRVDPTVWGAAAGPLAPAQVDAYDARGYHAAHDLIDGDDVRVLLAETQRLSAELGTDARVVREEESGAVRSVFDVHRLSAAVAEIVARPDVVGAARQILGSDVYVHQSRLNFKPGFAGGAFYWHSDFETWHAEDGMPTPRAMSISIALTDNLGYNGGLMIMPGSHREYVSCAGTTPDDYYLQSLVTAAPPTGSPDEPTLTAMADRYGIDVMTGPAGSATMFDSNCMHGSNGNITPFPRSNLFVVFNSVDNTLEEPFAARRPRPDHLGSRDFTPVR